LLLLLPELEERLLPEELLTEDPELLLPPELLRERTLPELFRPELERGE
jgi:hypothetical protein